MENERRLGNRLKTFMFVAVGFLIVSCGGGDDNPEPSAQELTYEKLAGQWSLPATRGVVVDGVDRSLNYDGFRLSFTESGYTTTNAGDLFKASGTWDWANSNTVNELSLDDGKSIIIQSLSTTQFVFSFTQSEGGIRAGVSGNYTISVNK